MSFARMLLAAVATGLAACAHTPQSDASFSLPDIRRAAPVIVVNSTEVPAGFDDHVVILIDRNVLEQAYASRTDGYGLPLFYDPAFAYRRPVRRPSGSSSGGVTRPASPPVSSAPPASRSAPVSRGASPGRNGTARPATDSRR